MKNIIIFLAIVMASPAYAEPEIFHSTQEYVEARCEAEHGDAKKIFELVENRRWSVSMIKKYMKKRWEKKLHIAVLTGVMPANTQIKLFPAERKYMDGFVDNIASGEWSNSDEWYTECTVLKDKGKAFPANLHSELQGVTRAFANKATKEVKVVLNSN